MENGCRRRLHLRFDMLKFNQVSVRVKHKKGKDRKTRMPGRVFANGNIVFQDFIPGKDIVRILHVDRQAYALRPGKKRAAIAVLTESPVSISCIEDEKGIVLLLDHRQSAHIRPVQISQAEQPIISPVL